MEEQLNPAAQDHLSTPISQVPPHLTRHVSLIYGFEFQSKVALFQRSHSVITQQLGFQSLSRQTIFLKVHNFLANLIASTELYSSFMSTFRQLDKQMQISIRRSRQSISSSQNSSSQQDLILKDMSNSSGISHTSVKLVRARTSMMSKSNRISIADAIDVSQLHNFKEKMSNLEAIDSANSVESDLPEIITRRNVQSGSIESMGEADKWLMGKAQRSKKISIMVVDDFDGADSELFSQEEIISLRELNPPCLSFTPATVQVIFDSPSPFMINLAICLLLKCLSRCSLTPTTNNTSWLLSIATVIAYKIYYDEPVLGLLECFSDLLGVSVGAVANLQRWFLQALNYEVVVSNRQYQEVMFQLLNACQ